MTVSTLDRPTTKRPNHYWTIPQIRRAVVLVRAGLSDAAVAVVLGVDLGVDVSAGAVRHMRKRYAPDVRNGRGAVGVSVDNRANFPGRAS